MTQLRTHAAALAVAIALGGAVTLGSADARNPGAATPTEVGGLHCVPAAYDQIRLPAAASVDDIRVFVTPGSPSAGAALVRVETNRGDRVLRVRGDGSRGLAFQPALVASTYHVSVDPVFSAPTSACIERIELWSRGARVAVVHP